MVTDWLQKNMRFLSQLFSREELTSMVLDEDAEQHLRLLVAVERSRLRKGPGPNAVVRNRFAKKHSRKLLKTYRQRRPGDFPKELLLARCRESPILDSLLPDRESNWIPILKRPRLSNSAPSLTLENFNMLDNPSETLQAFRAMAMLEASVPQAYLHFNDEYCVDAGAYLILAEVWPQMARIFHGGRMNGAVQKVLHATSVGQNNRMKLRAAESELLVDGEYSDIWAFPLLRRRPANSSRSPSVHLDPQTREEAADLFGRWVDEILGVPEINQTLTTRGRAWIGGMIGELLCNAERHSSALSTDGDWSTTAFMVRRDGHLRCYMAFLSVGQSFSESLKQAAPEIQDLVNGYARHHCGRGLTEDALATLIALQDSITCDPEAREERSGGTGLQDVLEFVSMLAGGHREESDAKVTIVSGSSCIRLRYPYLCGKRRSENAPRLLWCNDQNDSNATPDSEFVQSLEEHFAGTLVSVEFTLDPEYLASLVRTENGNDQS